MLIHVLVHKRTKVKEKRVTGTEYCEVLSCLVCAVGGVRDVEVAIGSAAMTDKAIMVRGYEQLSTRLSKHDFICLTSKTETKTVEWGIYLPAVTNSSVSLSPGKRATCCRYKKTYNMLVPKSHLIYMCL